MGRIERGSPPGHAPVQAGQLNVPTKIVTIVGARPQFVKAAMLSHAIAAVHDMHEVLVHTGQHFDAAMSDVFFRQLDMPAPAYHLGIGGGTHGQNTGRMLEHVEAVLQAEQPDWVLVYGDTDSTLAGALAAAKLHVPVAHVEAGLRSFNRSMPEEINRVLTDHVAALLFAPTQAAVANLAAEGITGDQVRLVGDVMYDAALYFGSRAEQESRALLDAGVEAGRYVLLTLHRPGNTDERGRLAAILQSMADSPIPIVWPLHPRSRQRMRDFSLEAPATVILTEPVSYLDMVMLEKHAALIATDSGGVQKEAYFHRVPCVTLRAETEWVELVEIGVNRLVGNDLAAFAQLLAERPVFPATVGTDSLYGDGRTAARILAALR